LRFGTGEGEGGSFALFQGLYPPPREDIDGDRVLTGDSAYRSKSVSNAGQLSGRFRWPLLAWVGHRLELYPKIYL
jgi:KUP system potassium uptake protein